MFIIHDHNLQIIANFHNLQDAKAFKDLHKELDRIKNVGY